MGYTQGDVFSIAREKTNIMLRSMSADVTMKQKKLIDSLYDDTVVGKSCAKWQFQIVNFCNDMNRVKGFVTIIMMSYELGMNLDDDKNWMRMMRFFLPIEFVTMYKDIFAQVPQMARLDAVGSEKPEKATVMFTDIKMV